MAFGSAGGAGGPAVAGAPAAPAPRPRPPPPPAPPPPKRISQIPEKSTLPSDVRGAGASRLGFPSTVRGMPGVGYDGHCASSDGASATHPATTHTALNHRVIHCPPAVSLFRRQSLRQRVCLSQVMAQMADVIGGDESQRLRRVRTDRQRCAAPRLGNPLDHAREVTVVSTPERNQVLPRGGLISLHGDPMVLRITRARVGVPFLRTHETLMVVRGRVDQVSEHLLRRPLPSGARLCGT